MRFCVFGGRDFCNFGYMRIPKTCKKKFTVDKKSTKILCSVLLAARTPQRVPQGPPNSMYPTSRKIMRTFRFLDGEWLSSSMTIMSACRKPTSGRTWELKMSHLVNAKIRWQTFCNIYLKSGPFQPAQGTSNSRSLCCWHKMNKTETTTTKSLNHRFT